MVKHIPHALTTAALAFAATFASVHPAVGFILWPALVGWACYLLSGAQPVNGLRTLANLVFGGIVAVGVFKLGTFLTNEIGTFAFPVAIATAFFVMSMTQEVDYVKRYLNLPVFQVVGMATYYGLGYNDDVMNVANMGGLFLIGMAIGYANYHARNYVAKLTHRPSPWPAYRKRIASHAAGEKQKKAA